MDNSGEVADLMVKESIQLTEAAVKMLAAGSKNLAAFLMALSQNNKKLYGKANMARLLQTGRELKTFHIKESDLEDFRAYAKKNVLFSVIKDTRSTSGIVDLVTKLWPRRNATGRPPTASPNWIIWWIKSSTSSFNGFKKPRPRR